MKLTEIYLRSKSKVVCATFCGSFFGGVKTFMKPGKACLSYLLTLIAISLATPLNGAAQVRDFLTGC